MLRPTKYATFDATTDDGTLIRIMVPRLGRGSYGTVHPIANDESVAAKLYHDGVDRAHPKIMRRQSAKLTEMTHKKPPEGGPYVRIAWPTATLKVDEPNDEGERDGTTVDGYLMARAPDERRSLLDIGRRSAGSAEARRAADLLGDAARTLHEQGIVIGDINGNNFALADDGILWMFDTDGWQFTDANGDLHHALGATDRYTDPELRQQGTATRPNCVSPRCPLAGIPHRPTASCKPREPRHDRHGIRVLQRELQGSTG